MNNFKSIRVISEAAAAEYVLDDDDSEEELAPRADGEAEFVDLHTAVSIAHPVAGDNQFKSDKDQAVTKNAESDNAEGEDKPVKQGTTGDTKFAQFRDKLGKTPARKGDKSQGDMKAETVKEEVELDEAKYDLYHRDFSSAMQHAYKMAKKNYGITIDPKEIDDKVATGPRKPPEGKTNKYRLKGDKGGIQVQVYNKGGSKPFELNMYKEEVELDEAVKAGMMKLKDGKSVKVSPDEAKMFNDVLKELNPENRKRMEMEMMKDQKSYKSMLTFAKRTA